MRTPFIALATLVGLTAGCSRQSAPAAPNVAVAVESPPAAAVTPPAPQNASPPGAAPASPPAFTFPSDSTGRELPRVVTPQAPTPLPVERFGAAPSARTPPARVVDPDPIGKTRYTRPPVLPGKSAGLSLPATPAERVPLDLGIGAKVATTRPTLPESPGIAQKAPDLTIPPPLTPLARQVPDRAGVDDPTAEPGNAIIASQSPNWSLIQAAFLKVGLPDPFELADQVRPKVDPAAEPGLMPVPVNPQRPK